jgi:multidrug resistance protein MdtO
MNLQEFKTQTSLVVARDRVLGILLGLVMMWLVFDQFWRAPAAVEMKREFISVVRLLAQLAREPSSTDRRAAIERSYTLREAIDEAFDAVRALADGVLFEFGPSRQQGLTLRDQIRRWGPELRTLFLTRIALLKYRLQLPGFELPGPIRAAQIEFDEQLAGTLDWIADRIEGKEPSTKEHTEDSLSRLEQATSSCCSELPEEVLTAQLQSFLPLCRRIENLTSQLGSEVESALS